MMKPSDQILKQYAFLFLLFLSFTNLSWGKAISLKWETLAEYDLTKKTLTPKLKKVLGKTVHLTGHMIPTEFAGKMVKEFLFVPYFPSCMHVPPPPENQIIQVKVQGKKGLKAHYGLLKIGGKLLVATEKKQKDPYMPTGIYKMNAKSFTLLEE